MEYASVDLPEPFGPMIACVSPSLMVRSTPFRISLGPLPSLPVSTVTCRSRISSVDMCISLFRLRCRSGSDVVQGGGHVDEHVVAVDLHGVDRDRLGRGKSGGLAGAEVEARTVQPALDLTALDVPLGQRDRGVRALVVDGVPLLAVTDHGHGYAATALEDGRDRLPGLQVADAAGALESHQAPPTVLRTFFSSSASTVASSRASMAGTPILRMMSAKKPCTTSRRASSSSIPRDCR